MSGSWTFDGRVGPCGDFVPEWVCRNVQDHAGARALVVGHIGRCERRECPSCAGWCDGTGCPAGLRSGHPGGRWAHEAAKAVTERWAHYRRAHGVRRPLRQIIVSAPPGAFTEEGDHQAAIEAIRRRAGSFLTAHGWIPSDPSRSVVVHLWRGCEGRYDEWGPHGHILCFGVDVRFTARYEARTGWVVKQATADGTPRTQFVGYGGRRLYRHLVYELGHSAILADRHAVTYGGPLHAEPALECDAEASLQQPTPRCAECRSAMERWSVLDHLAPSLEGWGMWWVGCDRRVWVPVRLLPDGPPARSGEVTRRPEVSCWPPPEDLRGGRTGRGSV